MANPLKTFLKAIFGKSAGSVSKEEIKKAEMAGEMAANRVEERTGFVPPAKVNADMARAAVAAKTKVKESAERTN